ncbi:NAD-dependent epimerase/dehydratase family protein [Candidatus Parcubacteria bacterium]|nr:NAD-dependent epimerase/dehydratase family protein [Candidatus Parcubacteria bacterium]
MKKALVIGGAGFIGSHLVDALVEKGYSVYVLDNLSNGKRELVNKKATLQVGDIRNPKDLAEAFKNIGEGAYVFHLACLPRVQFSIDFPRESHDANINGTLNVFLAARDAKAKRVVYSASSSAYGDQDALPLVETMKPNPKSPYGLQKHVGELYAKIASEVYGLETISLRYFNVFGPRQDPDGSYAQAIPKFLKQAKEGKPITITGDGEQTRDCTHVRDVVRANILAAESPKVGKGEVINIGGGKSYSVNQMAKLIGGKISYIPARLEPKATLADIRLAKKLLGWEPQMTLEEGIAELKKLYGI